MNLGLTPDQVMAAIGFFLPLLVAVVKRQAFADWINAVIAFVTYVIASVVLAYVTDPVLTFASVETAFLLVAGSGTLGYIALWKNTLDPPITAKINASAPTTPPSPPAAPAPPKP